jgi:hypothetical protein
MKRTLLTIAVVCALPAMLCAQSDKGNEKAPPDWTGFYS